MARWFHAKRTLLLALICETVRLPDQPIGAAFSKQQCDPFGSDRPAPRGATINESLGLASGGVKAVCADAACNRGIARWIQKIVVSTSVVFS